MASLVPSTQVATSTSGVVLPPITLADLQLAMGLGPNGTTGTTALGMRRRPLSLEGVITAEGIINSGILDNPSGIAICYIMFKCIYSMRVHTKFLLFVIIETIQSVKH